MLRLSRQPNNRHQRFSAFKNKINMSAKHTPPEAEYTRLLLEGHFTDAVIKCEDVEFKIHKIILCNCSLYFRSLFTALSSTGTKVFEISGLSPDIMRLIIECVYTGTVSVTGNNARDLLLAAHRLSVTSVAEVCCDFLGKQLCPDNCIGIYQLTKTCSCPLLQHKAYQFILDNFEEVVSSKEFQQLSVQDFCDILESDELKIREESTVFEAVHQWIAHEPDRRKEDLVLLLSKVRLALISSEYMSMKVVTSELVKSNDECWQMVADALKIKAWINTNNPPLSGVCNPVARPRLPKAILLAFGGCSGRYATNSIEAYDVQCDRWIKVKDHLKHPLCYHGIAFIDGCVYCFGGYDQMEHSNSVHRLDLSTRTWHEAAPMYFRRCYVSVTVLNGYIYALGGFDGYNQHRTAERYRPETNQWSLIEPMNEQRSDASCTVLHNKVYICGGFNGQECLQTCEFYSPETNQWTVITPMSIQRSGVGVIAYENHVFAVGGFNGRERLGSVEAYNPTTNTWHAVPPMLTPRSNFGIEIIDGQLFVVGGFSGLCSICDVEFYDFYTNEWCEAHNMKTFRSAMGCCMVSGLPNMVEYTVPRDTLPLLQLKNGQMMAGDS